ncbi:MAG: NADPH-dependent 7-cyano-7-deazaguanine reductase QueF [Gammaproteobacteria bacterium]|nr:NADPH-dependent 7-cyano-7-deazaguanine reductase QueF [Gammaproteobacteria bacterium]MBU1444178.1 NADPH-dependent 7-cyano-7-deazaguanine reductase QueF [Gammaproteobacteria bacterium]MBU2285250.1 NADPH-dependent 7-cyano-7-deazaguanine reductase QueF [Gammaproteobacteria bacterium]MBU2410712.1 NADPH-dependent 7-cyano-7-deazaguanine reductase QueF [Gammaproteobacteria bacterium]
MSIDSHSPEQSQLGRTSAYVDRYDAGLLYPISRATQRESMGIAESSLPFFGADLWTAYEVSWLNPRGKPQVAIARFTVPCETTNIIESKSFKLYLNSFNGSTFESADAVRDRLSSDLSEAHWRGGSRTGGIGVNLVAPESFAREEIQELAGLDLDRLDIECTRYRPAPELLSADALQVPVSETLTSRLLKSNCLVTGQPDWGSVQVRYTGPPIEQAGLLAYIVSFRDHNEFHEPCVERMFNDIWRRCRPTKLSVYARYTRRGGLDISPFRTSWPQALPASVRTARQ